MSDFAKWLLVCLAFPPLMDANANDKFEFPVPRAQAEFDELLQTPMGYVSQGKPSLNEALGAMMTYRPLDLIITGDATHKETSELRNFYFGASSNILGMPPNIMNVVTACQGLCLTERKKGLAKELPAWSAVAEAFKAAKGVELVGEWRGTDAFRVNDLIKTGTYVAVTKPSPVMGFIPGGKFEVQDSLQQALAERNINQSQLEKLLIAMTEAGAIAAHFGKGGWVEVIKIGLADNLSGVLFVPDGTEPPTKGELHPNGGEYSTVEHISDNAYFFETR